MSKTHERYRANGNLARNKVKVAKRHAHRMASKPADPRRGHTRMKRRQDMERFRRDALARKRQLLGEGTIRVNAPSLEMLGKFIGRAV